jgi:hypothetical protein
MKLEMDAGQKKATPARKKNDEFVCITTLSMNKMDRQIKGTCVCTSNFSAARSINYSVTCVPQSPT